MDEVGALQQELGRMVDDLSHGVGVLCRYFVDLQNEVFAL